MLSAILGRRTKGKVILSTMKILAIGDMHGNFSAVHTALSRYEPDIILSPGDWGDPGQIKERDLSALVENVYVLTVFGNHDDIKLLQTTTNTDGNPVLLGQGEIRDVMGFSFAGISGIWAKTHAKPYYVTDDDVERIVQSLAGRSIDVLITHGCPIGLADKLPGGRRGGQRCLLEAFRKLSPRLHICGHLHYAQRHALKDGRMVVNTGYGAEGDCWIISLTGQHMSAEFISGKQD